MLDLNFIPSSTRLGRRRHHLQIEDRYESLHRDYINRSIFGYIWIYNLLPAVVVESVSVKAFQAKCQQIFKDIATMGNDNWTTTFSPRYPRTHNPLMQYIA